VSEPALGPRRVPSDTTLVTPIAMVRVDVVIRMLHRAHESLAALPLAGLELRCQSCASTVYSGTNLAVGTMIEIERAIEALIAAR
jgi:hypothetical protein